MMRFLSFRYAFSKSGGHRSRVMRIITTSVVSLAAVLIIIAVMNYLQGSRFEAIREVRSFDIVVDGEHKEELSKLFPEYDIFVYGEGEAIVEDQAFLVRYVDSTYSGGVRFLAGELGQGIAVPYTFYLSHKYPVYKAVVLSEGKSGRIVPTNKSYPFSAVYATSLGYEFDNTTIFLPLSEADSAVDLKTAIKGGSPEDGAMLREMGYDVTLWQESESSLYSAFFIEKVMMYVVLSLLFVIIAVSSMQFVRMFYRGKRKERAELMVLGLGYRKVQRVFMLSFLIVTVISIILGLLLSIALFPMIEYLSPAFLGIAVTLTIPWGGFGFYSAFLIAVTLLFVFYERRKERGIDIMEVIHEQ